MPIQMASRAPPSTSSRLSSRHNRGIGIQVAAFLEAGATGALDGLAYCAGFAFRTRPVNVRVGEGSHCWPHSNDFGKDVLDKLSDRGSEDIGGRGSVLDIGQLLFPRGSESYIFEGGMNLIDESFSLLCGEETFLFTLDIANGN
jgi:hypothetical protein